MLVKMSVFNIELSTDINTIINDSINELTAENRNAINVVINEAHIQQQALEAAQKAKDDTESSKLKQMEIAFEELLSISAQSPNSFLSSQQILSIVTPNITNMISFVGKMRNWLIAQGKPYKLTSIKKGKEKGYRLDNTEQANNHTLTLDD